jgi:cytosine/adenosine deaminase-related metal-dependent hydrolase
MSQWSLTARWILPMDGPPLPNGIVVIDNDNIAAVESHGTRTADVDLGNVAISPGFVNAHTHLDLTGMRGKCPPTPDFTQWLRGVVAYRRQHIEQQITADIQTGMAESIAAGTTLIGDIDASGTSCDILLNASIRAVVFREMLGLSIERARQCSDLILGESSRPESPTCRRALSPHAPYSTGIATIRSAAWNGYWLAIHIAETREELQLLAHHTGPFREFLIELGAWAPQYLATSIEQVLRRCNRSPCVLYVHANFLQPDTWIPPHASIVYCPRTHAAFGHPPHPFREFLKRGVRVALGTDSLASNPDLSILAEMRFIHQRYPDFPGDALLRMGTLAGAEALGWADETGSLTPGKSADLAVVPLPDKNREPHELLFGSEHLVSRTMFRGQWVHP